jgi:hypothetical protein
VEATRDNALGIGEVERAFVHRLHDPLGRRSLFEVYRGLPLSFEVTGPMKYGKQNDFTGQVGLCQIEYLLDRPACASHADRGVTRGLRRPVIGYCSALNGAPAFCFIER